MSIKEIREKLASMIPEKKKQERNRRFYEVCQLLIAQTGAFDKDRFGLATDKERDFFTVRFSQHFYQLLTETPTGNIDGHSFQIDEYRRQELINFKIDPVIVGYKLSVPFSDSTKAEKQLGRGARQTAFNCLSALTQDFLDWDKFTDFTCSYVNKPDFGFFRISDLLQTRKIKEILEIAAVKPAEIYQENMNIIFV